MSVSLKQRVPYCLLVQRRHEWTLQVITDHGLGDLFEEVVISADLGIVKPDPDTYLRTLEKLRLPANQTIFVDTVR